MKWYLKAFKNYANFNGRARRKEYWMFTLFNIIFLIIAAILDNAMGMTFGPVGYGILYALYALATLIPNLAVTVRRLHDTGKSGWMILVGIIPLIGGIWLLVLMCTDGNPGENKYGPNPKNEPSFNNEALDSHLTT